MTEAAGRRPRRRKGRRGLRREPDGGWPLDDVLVGVATLRTIRELFRQDEEDRREVAFASLRGARAWDLALWNGVTPQGSANSLDRLHRAGLARELPPNRPWRAHRYRVDWSHPLARPMGRLLVTERKLARSRSRPPTTGERR